MPIEFMGWVRCRSLILAIGLFLLGWPAIAGAQIITEYPVPTSMSTPDGIAAGSDGALWFTEASGDKIGRISTTGAVTEFGIPTSSSLPQYITAGTDGALWFTEVNANKIGRITTAGTITEYGIPTSGSDTIGITAGPDGALWFAEIVGNKIGRITTAGAITEYPIPTAASSPIGIAAGPNGALWFTESDGNKIGRITTAGTITEYPIPTAASSPFFIAAGPDSALWFTEFDGNKIGRIATSGAVTEFLIPSSGVGPFDIAAGPDGALWFTEDTAIGRITTAGAITEYPIPTAGGEPAHIVAGPDGALWFTDAGSTKIGRITTPLSTHRDTSDFNADGKSDILWQNTNGQADIWVMNGVTPTTKAAVSGNPGPSWQGDRRRRFHWQPLFGHPVAEFEWCGRYLGDERDHPGQQNRDRQPRRGLACDRHRRFQRRRQIRHLWQNTNGAVAIWLMNGTTPISRAGARAIRGPRGM